MTPALSPLQLGIPGGTELLVILLIAVLLFGANKIPKLARSTGQAMGEFQRGRTEIEQELEEITDPSATPEGDEDVGAAETENEAQSEADDTDETK